MHHRDSRRKKVWPILDLTSVITFAILFGVAFAGPSIIGRWLMVIVPGE